MSAATRGYLRRWGGGVLDFTSGDGLIRGRTGWNRSGELYFQRKLKRNGLHISITASIGVAEHQAQEPAEDLIKRADLALYQAKKPVEIKWC